MSFKLGLAGLIESRKGFLALLILAVSTVGMVLGKVTGEAFVGCMGIVYSVFSITHMLTNQTAIKSSAAVQSQLLGAGTAVETLKKAVDAIKDKI